MWVSGVGIHGKLTAPRIHVQFNAIFSLMLRSLLLLFLLTGCNGGADDIAIGGATMGTTWSVQLVAPPVALDRARASAGVSAILERVDREMSTWRTDSAVSRFNRWSATDGWFPISPTLAEVIGLAGEVTDMTAGGFDITVGSLVELWGFGPTMDRREEATVPDGQRLRRLRGSSGARFLHLRMQPPALKKDHAGLKIDLSAIAKGFAVDQVADWLQGEGVENYLVEVGGELRLAGRNAKGGPWRVAVERPGSGPREVFAVLSLSGRAVATSGDYRNFFEAGGQRYSHTIDPATGKPVSHALSSVTVVTARAARADALATGLLALGPEAGFEVARREGLAVLFIERRGRELRPRWTPALVRAVAGIEGVDAIKQFGDELGDPSGDQPVQAVKSP